MVENKDWLHKAYFIDKKSTTVIAKECNSSISRVRRQLLKFGFKLRTKSEALSGKNNPMFGKEVSKKTREKISISSFGKKHTEETKKIIGLVHKNKIVSEETKKKISEKALARFSNKCNHPMYGKINKWGKHTKEVKNYISTLKKGINNPMYGKYGYLNPMFGLRGNKHPAWKNEKSRLYSLSNNIRSLREYFNWKQAILKRDAFKCVYCKNNQYLEVDHIYPLILIIEDFQVTTAQQALNCSAFWNQNNGRTLCFNCHKQTETFGKNKIALRNISNIEALKENIKG